jgi:CBS domain-containing protein
MITKARDLMATKFYAIRPEMTIAEAIPLFQVAGSEEENRVFGMVVVDDGGQLVGMLSMYDILPLMRPSNIRDWEDWDDNEVNRLMDAMCNNIKATLVRDVMTHNVITITPDTHVVKILEIMIRRHIRRLPVLEGQQIIGMVYISTIFDYLGAKMISR